MTKSEMVDEFLTTYVAAEVRDGARTMLGLIIETCEVRAEHKGLTETAGALAKIAEPGR